jgi:hypothetical protein
MSANERLERCHECGEPVEVYASTCAACGANLIEATLKARCPVWEFAIDEEGEPGHDEETLRP